MATLLFKVDASRVPYLVRDAVRLRKRAYSLQAYLHNACINEIPDQDLFYLYDAVLAFNRPVINDPLLANCFSFEATDSALASGQLDSLLNTWDSLLP
jgi:hypothetical protein